MLCLSRELYIGFVRLQADRELGRAYAGLLPFTEGLFRLGYISKEVYEKHIEKYSQPLCEESPVLTPEQQEEKKLLERKDRQFKGQLDQWAIHSDPEWRKKVLADAEKWKEKVPSAKQLCELKSRVESS